MEKLQKILSRGYRNNVKGYDHFFWRDGIALLRNAYDMGATKPGSLMLHLGTKNTILAIECDDAGPAWDCNDDNSVHWVAINEWATRTLNSMAREHVEPRAARSIFYSYHTNKDANLDARSHRMLRDMAMEQWQGTPALKVVVDQLLPADLSMQEWLNRAQYLSEAITLDEPFAHKEFVYKGASFDSNCMLAWLVVAAFKEATHYQTQGDVDEKLPNSRAYTHARVVRKEERTETLYDWRVYTNPELHSDLFSGHFYVRIALDSQFSMFNHVRVGNKLHLLSEIERVACIKALYDIANGHALPLDPQQAYALDCERLATIKNSGAIERMSGTDIANALRVIADEWWQVPGSQGREMLGSIEALYPWEQMKKSTPRAALVLLADMGALSPPMVFDVSTNPHDPGLFELD